MDDDHIGEVFLEARMTEGARGEARSGDQVLDNTAGERRELELSQSQGERQDQADGIAGATPGFQ